MYFFKNDKFNNVIRIAETIANKNHPQGLIDLIKVIMKPVQCDYLLNVFVMPEHQAYEHLLMHKSFNIKGIIPEINDTFDNGYLAYHTNNIEKKLELKTDIVFATPWHRHRAAEAIGEIGHGLKCGDFIQDFANHYVTHVYPLNINWVNCGNHSIAQGIIRGEGTIITKDVYDFSYLISLIKYDGFNWRHISTNNKMGKPLYPEFGWVWEIGRLLIGRI